MWSKDSWRMAGLCEVKNTGDSLAVSAFIFPSHPFLVRQWPRLGSDRELWELSPFMQISVSRLLDLRSGFRAPLLIHKGVYQLCPVAGGSHRSTLPENCCWDCSFGLKKQLEVSSVAIQWTLKMHLWTERWDQLPPSNILIWVPRYSLTWISTP